MIDFAQLWQDEHVLRRAPDNAQAWDVRASQRAFREGQSSYVSEFLQRAALRPGETVFDMGCGAGALAIPCAENGHAVLAADFSQGMLDALDAQLSAATRVLVETKQLAWDENWHEAGVEENSYDVAFASRSIATSNMQAAIEKLAGVARRRVCITAATGVSPRVSAEMFNHLGISAAKHFDAAFVFAIALQLGFAPEVSYIHTQRTSSYASKQEAFEAHIAMLEHAEGLSAKQRHALEPAVQKWVESHLEAAQDQLVLATPRTFTWAFISWDVEAKVYLS